MTVRIINGDCLDALKTLPDQSVHCCVTSPPYWGLRDYGTAKWEGGDPDCDHRSPTMRDGRNEDRPKLVGSDSTNAAQLLLAHRTGCGKCGAVKVDGQIGLEATPAEYVEKMVAVFREVRRVLRDDGTLWCNMGDTYGTGTTAPWQAGKRGIGASQQLAQDAVPRAGGMAKQLLGMPWQLAFALQADGWYLRQDIIWAKPNPMPESVRDRCTKSHEYLFLLAKSEKYYCDMDAIAEPTVADHIVGNNTHKGATAYANDEGEFHRTKAGLVDYAQKRRSKRDSFKREAKEAAIPGQAALQHREGRDESQWDTATRNKRSVWTVATQPFKEAHFATFPPALIEPCILAGCPIGGTVLDPFGGAGTTGLVSDRLQRNAILIELNPAYAAMAENRIHADGPLFSSVTT